MVEGALNAAAEARARVHRVRQRCSSATATARPNAAPQGLYACAGFDRWLAISIETDEQWVALRRRARRARPGRAARARHARRPPRAPRRARRAPRRVGRPPRRRARPAELLVAHGVPAALGRDPRLLVDHPQLRARGFYETVDHPVVGAQADADRAVPLRQRRPLAPHARPAARRSTTHAILGEPARALARRAGASSRTTASSAPVPAGSERGQQRRSAFGDRPRAGAGSLAPLRRGPSGARPADRRTRRATPRRARRRPPAAPRGPRRSGG